MKEDEKLIYEKFHKLYQDRNKQLNEVAKDFTQEAVIQRGLIGTIADNDPLVAFGAETTGFMLAQIKERKKSKVESKRKAKESHRRDIERGREEKQRDLTEQAILHDILDAILAGNAGSGDKKKGGLGILGAAGAISDLMTAENLAKGAIGAVLAKKLLGTTKSKDCAINTMCEGVDKKKRKGKDRDDKKRDGKKDKDIDSANKRRKERQKSSDKKGDIDPKSLGKSLGKSASKKIPIVGAILATGYAVNKVMDGDIIGGIAEVASGLASIVPVAGTAASTGIDAWSAGRSKDDNQVLLKDINSRHGGMVYNAGQSIAKALGFGKEEDSSNFEFTPPPMIGASGAKGKNKALLEFISQAEGTNDSKARSKGYKSGYDVTLGYGAYADDKTKPVTEMTLKELKAHQTKMLAHPDNKLNSSAAGKYQYIRKTLFGSSKNKGLVELMGLSMDEKFTPELQDRLANHTLKGRGIEKFNKDGDISENDMVKAIDELSKEWASLPYSKTGKSFYGQHTAKKLSDVRGVLMQNKANNAAMVRSTSADSKTREFNKNVKIANMSPENRSYYDSWKQSYDTAKVEAKPTKMIDPQLTNEIKNEKVNGDGQNVMINDVKVDGSQNQQSQIQKDVSGIMPLTSTNNDTLNIQLMRMRAMLYDFA